eukprot:5271792-Amphidinium_carterae.1
MSKFRGLKAEGSVCTFETGSVHETALTRRAAVPYMPKVWHQHLPMEWHLHKEGSIRPALNTSLQRDHHPTPTTHTKTTAITKIRKKSKKQKNFFQLMPKGTERAVVTVIAAIL